jgi:hypothetical protein
VYGPAQHEWLSFEQVMAEALSAYGPLIAIGRPGEKLSPLGAARLWVEHGEWQREVDSLLEKCSRVVMVLGWCQGEDGLAWELRRLCGLATPQKIAIVVPPVEEKEVQRRWERFRVVSAGKVPPYQGGEILLTFGHGWEPIVARTVQSRESLRSEGARIYPEQLSTAFRSGLLASAVCGVCGGQASGTCKSCGAFYCGEHAGSGSLCTSCTSPADLWLVGFIGIAMGCLGLLCMSGGTGELTWFGALLLAFSALLIGPALWGLLGRRGKRAKRASIVKDSGRGEVRKPEVPISSNHE